jgi:non-ribosomal peptide synthetase component F
MTRRLHPPNPFWQQLSRTRLVQADCGGLLEPNKQYADNVQCQVRLHVKVLRGDISIFLEWRKGDMSGDQMKSVSNIFEQLLAKILSSENTAISQLNLFSENDWQRIRKWNSTIPQLYDRCIHDAIHDQMLSGPEREAVCAWDGSLTFAELDYQASKLACYLRMQGVGPEIRVALCFDKSVGSLEVVTLQ